MPRPDVSLGLAASVPGTWPGPVVNPSDTAADGADDAGTLPSVSRIAPQSSLRAQVADVLRSALITGEMRPGTVYSAPGLAARFGVSATPVREAMLDLVSDGLVEAVRNKGFRVTELSDAELDEITELRMLIEVPIVGSLAAGCSPNWDATFRGLRAVAAEIVAAAASGNLIAYVDADRRFHLELLGLSGNRRLVRLVGDLRAQSRLYGLDELARRGRLVQSAAEHDALLDLVAAGDVRGARALMRRHIRHVRELGRTTRPRRGLIGPGPDVAGSNNPLSGRGRW